jgi:hypothetical protein
LQSIVENPSFLYVFKPYILLFQTKIPFIMKKLLTTLALLCITAYLLADEGDEEHFEGG